MVKVFSFKIHPLYFPPLSQHTRSVVSLYISQFFLRSLLNSATVYSKVQDSLECTESSSKQVPKHIPLYGRQFAVPKWKIVCSDQWNNGRPIAEAECSSFPSLCNSPQTLTFPHHIQRQQALIFLTDLQAWCLANRFPHNTLQTHSL
jgi:hypothetical protein